ncbi:MAG: hypothetical protein P8099_13360 [Gemmatimonadota bacterium]|jgi:hypothetical protein
MRTKTFVVAAVPFPSLLALSATAPPGLAAQSVLVEAETTAGDQVATTRTAPVRSLHDAPR